MNSPQPGPTILFAEDDDLVREIVVETLRGAGYAVVAAGDGAEALEALARMRPDLILSDARMPRCDGFEFLQAVRRNPASRWTPFIIMSAKAETADQRLGMALGADDYLTKPCKTEDLLQSIAVRLERAAAIADLARRSRHFLARVVQEALREPLAEIAEGAGGGIDRGDSGAGSAPDGARTRCRMPARAGQRLTAVAEDLALLAWLDSDERSRRENETGPAEVSASRVREWCRQSADYHGRGQDLSVEVHGAEVAVSGRGLDRVIAHLVDNALRFSAPGSPVQVTGRRVEAGYEIAVCDRGMGGREPEPNEACGRADTAAVSGGAEGTGIGLMLARRFADLSGAEFRLARNDDGPGMRATLRLGVGRAG